MSEVLAKYPRLSKSKIVSETVRKIINMLVNDVIKNSNEEIKKENISTSEDVRNCKKTLICFSDEIKRLNIELKKFLYKNLYMHPDVVVMTNRANVIIKDLFLAYNNDLNLISEEYCAHNIDKINLGHKERVICDYIAGMTDRFAQQEHQRLFK